MSGCVPVSLPKPAYELVLESITFELASNQNCHLSLRKGFKTVVLCSVPLPLKHMFSAVLSLCTLDLPCMSVHTDFRSCAASYRLCDWP